MSYDCAFLMNDDKEMAAALWRRFFIDEPFDGPRLELLLKYVRLTMAKLDDMPTEDLVYGKRIKWLTLDSVNAS